MENPSTHARYFMLYEFQQETHPVDALSKINHPLKEQEKIDIATCRHWFRRFRMGNLSLENDPNPPLYWKSKPATEIIYDIFSFLDRVEIEKCQLLNFYFNTIISGGVGVLPCMSIQFMNIEFVEYYGSRIYIETEDFKYDYGEQNFDNLAIRSLKNCIIQKLYTKLGPQIVEVFKSLTGILGEPLKIIKCHCSTSSSNNVDPSQYFDVLTKYVLATNIQFDCKDFLRNYIKNYERLQLSPMPKTITILSSLDDISAFNVDDIRRFFLGLKHGNCYKLILVFIRETMLIDYFVIPFIGVFKEIEQPCQLIRNITLTLYNIREHLFEECLQRINLMKMVQQSINETIVDDDKTGCIYNGMLKRDNWLLNLKIKQIRICSDSDIVNYKVQLNVEEAQS